MKPIRWLILPVVLFGFACASQRPPATFLHTDFKPWNDWMNGVISVDITNLPLGALATRSAFQGMTMTLNDVDLEYRIALQADRVSRRQALWMLAGKYGLSMNVGTNAGLPSFIAITNRELRRPHSPLQ